MWPFKTNELKPPKPHKVLLGRVPKPKKKSEDKVLHEFRELKNVIYDLVKDVQFLSDDIDVLKNPKVKGGVGMSYLEKMDKDISLLKKVVKGKKNDGVKELKTILNEELKFKDKQIKELDNKIYGLENVFDLYREKSINKKDLAKINKNISDLNKSVIELNNKLTFVEKKLEVTKKKIDKVDVKELQSVVKAIKSVVKRLIKAKK